MIIWQAYQIMCFVVDQVIQKDVLPYHYTKAMQILIVLLLNPASHFIIQT